MTRPRFIALAIAAIAAIAVGGFLAYDQVLRGDAVAALTLPASTPAAGATSEPSTGTASGPATSGEPVTSSGVAGTWTVATGSQAGYRVREQLANLPAESDAVGRSRRHRLDHRRDHRSTAPADGRHADGRHDVDHLGRGSPRQPDAQRGPRDRQVPDRHVHLDPAGRGAGRGPGRDGVGPDAHRRPDPPRRDEVGRDPGPGAARRRHDPGRRFARRSRSPTSRSSPPNVGGFIVSIADEGTLEFLVNFTKG